MRDLVLHGFTGKFTWRMLASVLGGQSVVVLLGTLVARGIAATQDPDMARPYLLVGLGLTGLAVVAAAGLRSSWGVTLGWLVQVLCLASTLVVPMMGIIGVIFLALWVGSMIAGRRVDRMMAERERSMAQTEA